MAERHTVRLDGARDHRLRLTARPRRESPLLLALAFFLRYGLTRAREDEAGGEGLATMISLVSYDITEVWLMLPWLVAFYGLVVYTLYHHLKAGTLGRSAL